jgi:hypothetical protein
MTKNEANHILDKIREGYPMSLLVTTQALQRTGDIPDISDNPLRTNGNESRNDRASPMENTGTEKGFSYSRYLDSEQNKGVKE